MRLMERLRDMLAAVSTSTLKKREQRRFGLLTKRAPDEMKNDAVSLANRMTVRPTTIRFSQSTPQSRLVSHPHQNRSKNRADFAASQ